MSSSNGKGLHQNLSLAPKARPEIGLLEWFNIGDKPLVENVLRDLELLSVRRLRTGVSWADWHRPEGEQWYKWLIPTLAEKAEILPCVLYTPPSMGISAKTSSPPREPKWYADFLDRFVHEVGEHFEYIELWNEANNLSEWDWTVDADWMIFSEMVGGAAYWMRQMGKKTVLGGMSPADPHWLRLMCERGVLDHIDVVGLHGFPGAWEYSWEGWDANVEKLQKVLDEFGSKAEIWITETGYSTWRNDEFAQVLDFVDVLKAPVPRVYWYGCYDLDPHCPTVDGFHSDEREYHFGLKECQGRPKLLSRLWESTGIEGVVKTAHMAQSVHIDPQRILTVITGGAGFIGTNLADRLLSQGREVLIFDNLSRAGVERNLQWIKETHGSEAHAHIGDVRNIHAVRKAISCASSVFHFAAQVAVTSSLTDPRHDFEVNAGGTLNVLEEIRLNPNNPPLIFTSTNKVYGGLEDVALKLTDNRYEPVDLLTRTNGIDETRPLDFHSPYGCSKGAADQYVIDYSRTMGLRSAVFRMSCIYGPHQFGTEDQGWVAHFVIQALKGKPITLYGDGKQVRDILFVEDLVDALLLAEQNIDRLSSQAFNMGGGPTNAVSLLELIELIERLSGRRLDVLMENWRPGDQRYYVSDTGKFETATGWRPRVSFEQGVRRLFEWLEGASTSPQAVAGRR